MYKTFMKHAEKITESPVVDQKPVLQGVKHYANGNAAVTDSHRLYYVKEIHDKGDMLLSSKGEKIEGNYPEVHRLIPKSKLEYAEKFSVDELITATDLAVLAAKMSDAEPYMILTGNNASFNSDQAETAFEFPGIEPIKMELYSNAQYWLDALKMFKAFKYTEVVLSLYDKHRPFTLISLDEKLMALILPVRRR